MPTHRSSLDVSIEIQNLQFAHTDSVPLIRELSLTLHAGWLGVVGPNGAGKTTLLHLLTGSLRPDAGLVRRHPGSLDVRLCPQRVEALDDDVRGFATARDREAQRLRGRLALDPNALARWPSLSPGERKRWQVGCALAAEPDALLLDEPTNHLDPIARALLEDALLGYAGIGVVVSHARDLLNRLCPRTLRFHAGGATLYAEGYDAARRTWEAQDRSAREEHDRLRGEQKRLRKRLAKRREKQARAQRDMRTSRRMKNAGDSDMRLRFKQSRRRSADTALGREIDVVHGQIDRIDGRAAEVRFDKTLGSALFVDHVRARVPVLAAVETRELCAGQHVVAREVRAELRREDRIWLAGPNGSGKTTLLAALAAAARIPSAQILYLPQELDEARAAQTLERARSLDPEARGRLLNCVAALGVDPAALLASSVPSPGEARKLALAFGLSQQVQALLLDEPTNHLDLPSIERLEATLGAYPGALVVVSHDEAFARALTTERWEIVDDRLGCAPC